MSLNTIAGLPIMKVAHQEPSANILIYGESGVGKGHPHGTLLLSPNGWQKIEDLIIGDTLIDANGNSTSVTGIYPRGMLRVFNVIFNDGSSVMVDEEHLWVSRTNNHQSRNQPWLVVDTAFMRSTLHRKWRIPMVEPIKFSSKDLQIDPYVLGVLIGDGSFVGSSVRLSTDLQTATKVQSMLPKSVNMVPIESNDTRSSQWFLTTERGQDNPLLDAIKTYGLYGKHSHNKFIPENYLFSSIEDRIALLQGLMDTDGELSIREDIGSAINYSTASSQLADDVEFLIQSLGGVASRALRLEPKYLYKGEMRTGRPSHRICICLPESIYPFGTRKGYIAPTKYLPNRVVRDIVPIGEDAEVICISVDSPTKTYITEHCIVTHNTTLAGSADAVPEMRKVLVLDIEGGLLSLKERYPDVDNIRIKSWADLQAVYDELYTGTHGYRTIILDSLTEAQKMSMDTVMRKLVEMHEERDADVPGIREWNINIEQTRKFVRALRDLPVTTIFTALAKQDKNPKTGVTKTKPSLSGKVADEVAGFLDIVSYLYTKEVDGEQRRMLLCGSTQDHIAKDRTGKLEQVIWDPDMNTIWNAIKGFRNNDATVEG